MAKTRPVSEAAALKRESVPEEYITAGLNVSAGLSEGGGPAVTHRRRLR